MRRNEIEQAIRHVLQGLEAVGEGEYEEGSIVRHIDNNVSSNGEKSSEFNNSQTQ